MEIILICYQGFPVTTSKGLEIKVGAHGLLEERWCVKGIRSIFMQTRRKGTSFLSKWYVWKGKGLELEWEPPRIKLMFLITPPPSPPPATTFSVAPPSRHLTGKKSANSRPFTFRTLPLTQIIEQRERVYQWSLSWTDHLVFWNIHPYSLRIENEKPSFVQGGLKTKTKDQTTAASKSL